MAIIASFPRQQSTVSMLASGGAIEQTSFTMGRRRQSASSADRAMRSVQDGPFPPMVIPGTCGAHGSRRRSCPPEGNFFFAGTVRGRLP